MSGLSESFQQWPRAAEAGGASAASAGAPETAGLLTGREAKLAILRWAWDSGLTIYQAAGRCRAHPLGGCKHPRKVSCVDTETGEPYQIWDPWGGRDDQVLLVLIPPGLLVADVDDIEGHHLLERLVPEQQTMTLVKNQVSRKLLYRIENNRDRKVIKVRDHLGLRVGLDLLVNPDAQVNWLKIWGPGYAVRGPGVLAPAPAELTRRLRRQPPHLAPRRDLPAGQAGTAPGRRREGSQGEGGGHDCQLSAAVWRWAAAGLPEDQVRQRWLSMVDDLDTNPNWPFTEADFQRHYRGAAAKLASPAASAPAVPTPGPEAAAEARSRPGARSGRGSPKARLIGLTAAVLDDPAVLRWAAGKAAEMVADGQVRKVAAMAALQAAGEDAGLPGDRARSIVFSAFRIREAAQ